MGLSADGYIALIWALSAVILVAMTLYALACGWYFRRSNTTQENFITARGQVSMWRIAWSFYAGAVGAWVITGPASYSPFAGVIGLVMYAVSSGLPVIMIAYAGGMIQSKLPHVLSLTDFIGWRYGWVAKTYVVLLCCFNMSIAMLAEYTTMGALFGIYVGSTKWPIIVVVAVLTTAYTIYGGLVVSIYTDQIQGITSIVFFLIIAVYMAVMFRPSLPTPIPCTPYNDDTNPMGFCIAGTSETGYSSFFSMPASLFTATVFSEAMWQRAWASSSARNLRMGAWIGCIGIVLVVFFAGLCGLLAAWGGIITVNTDINLYMIQALTGAINSAGRVSNWVGVIVVLLAVTMNMSAVDSLQNGLGAAISSHLLKGVRHSLAWTRVAVLLVNVPLCVLGTKGYSVLQLFLLANMLCSTSALPVLAGLIECLYPYVGGASMIASCLLSFLCTSIFGVDYYYNMAQFDPASPLFDPTWERNVAHGMEYTWLKNNYNWKFFAVSIGVSVGSMIVFATLNWLWARFGRGKPAVMGFVAPATHPQLHGKGSKDGTSDEESEKQDSATHYKGEPPSPSHSDSEEKPDMAAAPPVA